MTTRTNVAVKRRGIWYLIFELKAVVMRKGFN